MRGDKVSKEEMERILNNISGSDYEELEGKRSIFRSLKGLEKNADLIMNGAIKLREYFSFESPNLHYIKKEIEKINSAIRRSVDNIYELSLYSGFINSRDGRIIMEEKLSFKSNGEHLHIDFPTLLPRRLNKGSVLSASDIKNMYEPAFTRNFAFGKHKIYSKKAVIIYTHYFKSEKELVDHDNFETKVITDLITSWLLPDDSPKFCSLFMDYRMGEYSHTEVDVVPFERLSEFIQ